MLVTQFVDGLFNIRLTTPPEFLYEEISYQSVIGLQKG